MKMNKIDYEIRLATQDDIEQIANLYIKSWHRTYTGLLSQDYLNSLDVHDVSNRWGEYIKEPSHGIFVACRDKKVLGFGAFKPYHRIDDCIYIESLHVDETCQGRGVGSSIIEKIHSVGVAEKYGQMAVCLVKGNNKARELYTKLGAVHYKDKVDDFTGEVSYSEILTWDLG